jgi:hypothetical protein
MMSNRLGPDNPFDEVRSVHCGQPLLAASRRTASQAGFFFRVIARKDGALPTLVSFPSQ